MKKEPKQETTSEGFHRISKEIDYSEFDFVSFKIGIEWQQEQDKNKYSDEDIKKAYCNGADLDYDIMISTIEGSQILKEWFEQFKNK